jgi:hypothetical protein
MPGVHHVESAPLVNAERPEYRMIEHGARPAERVSGRGQTGIQLTEHAIELGKNITVRPSGWHYRRRRLAALREVSQCDDDELLNTLPKRAWPGECAWAFLAPPCHSCGALRVRERQMLDDSGHRPFAGGCPVRLLSGEISDRVEQEVPCLLNIRMHGPDSNVPALPSLPSLPPFALFPCSRRFMVLLLVNEGLR